MGGGDLKRPREGGGVGWGERQVRQRGATSLGSPNSSEVFFFLEAGGVISAND